MAGVARGLFTTGEMKGRRNDARRVAVPGTVGGFAKFNHLWRLDVIGLGNQRPFAAALELPAKKCSQKSDSEGQFDPAPPSLRHNTITYPLANGDNRADAHAFGPADSPPAREKRVW